MSRAKQNKEANERLELAKKAIERATEQAIERASKRAKWANVKRDAVEPAIEQEPVIELTGYATKIKAVEATIHKQQVGAKRIFKVYLKTGLYSKAIAVDKDFGTSTKARNWIVEHVDIVK